MRLLKMVANASLAIERDNMKDHLGDAPPAVVAESAPRKELSSLKPLPKNDKTLVALPPTLVTKPESFVVAADNFLWDKRDTCSPSPEPAPMFADEDPVADEGQMLEKAQQKLEEEDRQDEEFHYKGHLKKHGLDPRKYDSYNPRALGFLRLDNRIRIGAIRFAEWPWFDRFILAAIFINSGFLAAFDPLDTPSVHPYSAKRDLLEVASKVFTWFFLAEFLVKICAYGFYFGKGSYLSSPWNWLDFGIVLISLLDFLPGGAASNLSAVRTFRVMRPLRAITRFKELRFLVRLLLQCIPMLMNVVGLCAFIFFVFGILGVQLWQGTLRQRCYSMVTGEPYDSEFLCSISPSGYHHCPEGYECLPLADNPNFGVTHFDNIMGAILTIFQVMTYEGWTVNMYLVEDAFSQFAIMYFVMLIFVGPVFAVQLFLVVISNKFAETRSAQKTVDAFGGGTMSSSVKKSVWQSHPVLRFFHKHFMRWKRSATEAVHEQMEKIEWVTRTTWFRVMERGRSRLKAVMMNKWLNNMIVCVIIINTVFMAMEHDCDLADDTSYCKGFKLTLEFANLVFTTIFAIEMTLKLLSFGPELYLSDNYNKFDCIIVIISLVEVPDVLTTVNCLTSTSGEDTVLLCEGGGSGLLVLRTFRLVRVGKLLRAFPALQRQIKVVAATLASVSALLVLICLFLSIFAILGMNLFGGMWNPAVPDDIYLGSAVVLEVPFVAELRHAVVTSMDMDAIGEYKCDLFFPLPDGTETVLATFAEFGAGNSPFATIVGVVPRQNFNKLLNAVMTTFQILTQEDWPFIMYTASRTSGMWVSLYFIALIVIGNYMLLNLFIAIIIQGFADEKVGDLDDDDEDDDASVALSTSSRSRWTKIKATALTFFKPGAKSNKIAALDAEPAADPPRFLPQQGSGELLKPLPEPVPETSSAAGVGVESASTIVRTSSMGLRSRLSFNSDDMPDEEDGAGWSTTPDTKAGEEEAEPRGMPRPKSTNAIGSSNRPQVAKKSGSRGNTPPPPESPKYLRDGVAPSNAFSASRHSNGAAPADSPKAYSSVKEELVEETGSEPEEDPAVLCAQALERRVQKALRHMEIYMPHYEPPPSDSLSVMLPAALAKAGMDGGDSSPTTSSPGLLGRMLSFSTPRVNLKSAGNSFSAKQSAGPGWENWQGADNTPRTFGAHTPGSVTPGGGRVSPPTGGLLSPASGAWGNQQGMEMGNGLVGMSLFCLSPNNKIRTTFFSFTSHPKFDHFILFCILMSSVSLAMERPGIVGTEAEFLDWLNTALNIAFLVECILKVVANGFFVYIKSPWNKLDFFIVVTSVVDALFEYSSGGGGSLKSLRILRIFRIFRALRPLRVISRARGLRIVVMSITGSVKPILNTVFIAGMVFLVFGILGVQLLSGKLHYCSDPAIFQEKDCKGFRADNTARVWLNQKVNFDNIGEAMLTMFVLASMDDWPKVMWSGVDATGKRTGPKQDNNQLIVLYFLASLLIAAFLVINIFVGVFVDNYNTASEKVNASIKIKRMSTRKRKVAALNAVQVPEETEPEPSNRVQQLMVWIVSKTSFDLGIAACIALNVITMAFESYKQSLWQQQFLVISNYFFTYVFGLECVMKLIAYLPKRYFKDGWNKFDFTIVMISFMGVAIEESGATIALNPTILRVLRVFRIFRILRAFRIFKAAKGLQAIVDTLGKSLPAVGNLGGLLFLLFFIYGILAVQLFGNLCITEDQSPNALRCKIIHPDVLLDSHASFRNIAVALLTLFRVATGDAWGEVMQSCKLAMGERGPRAFDIARAALAENPPNYQRVYENLPGCVDEDDLQELGITCGELPCETTCGHEYVAPLFFASFVAIANFVLLNLVIAVLMQQLADSEKGALIDDMITERMSRSGFARVVWKWRCNARVHTLRNGLPVPPPLQVNDDFPDSIEMHRDTVPIEEGHAGMVQLIVSAVTGGGHSEEERVHAQVLFPGTAPSAPAQESHQKLPGSTGDVEPTTPPAAVNFVRQPSLPPGLSPQETVTTLPAPTPRSESFVVSVQGRTTPPPFGTRPVMQRDPSLPVVHGY